MPGGMGMRLKYSNPMYMDDVAADFPGPEDHPRPSLLPLAGRGALGRDPQAERLYRPLRLVAEIFSADFGALHQLDPAGQDAVGSDWPVIMPDRWLSDFAKLEIREEIRPKVMKANARKILGI